MNLFHGTVAAADGALWFVETNPSGPPLRLALPEPLARRAAAHGAGPVVLGLRPEAVQEAAALPAPDPARTAEARVDVSEPLGPETFVHLDTGATRFVARLRPGDRFAPGHRLRVAFDLGHSHLFDPATERRLET